MTLKQQWIKQFRMFVPNDDGSAMDWFENVLEKAVQEERKRVKSNLPAVGCPSSGDEFSGPDSNECAYFDGRKDYQTEIISLLNKE